MPVSPRCVSAQTVKNGRIHNGKQRFKCHDCERQFAEQPTRKVNDQIKADHRGVDRIQLTIEGAQATTALCAVISASQLALGAAADDSSDRFIYSNISGELFFDRDGTGSQAQVLLATLSGAPTISNADIIVV